MRTAVGCALPVAMMACGGRGAPPDPVFDDVCDAQAAGVAGGVEIETRELSWQFDRKGDLSWADPIAVRLADDIVGVSLTVDDGQRETGVGWMVLDGERIWDGLEPRRGRRGQRVSGFADTGASDTGWLPDRGWGWGVGPWFHWPETAGTVVLPIDETSGPTPGCLVWLPVTRGDRRNFTGTAHVVTKRSAPIDVVLDLDVGVVEGAGISDEQVDAVIQRISTIYGSAGGPTVGEVETFALTTDAGAWLDSVGDDIRALRALPMSGRPLAQRLIFVGGFLDDGFTLGLSGGIPGPIGVPGTPNSAVVVSIGAHQEDAGLDTDLLGETSAHELGHQLGLFHTVEYFGDPDALEDTPECDLETYDVNGDGEVSADECEGRGDRNLMFWGTGDHPQVELSSAQVDVLTHGPSARVP